MSVLLKDDHNGTKQETICLANIIWLKEYKYKCWFGGPVEMWRKRSLQEDVLVFISVNDIMCRCANVLDTIKCSYELEELVTVVIYALK